MNPYSNLLHIVANGVLFYCLFRPCFQLDLKNRLLNIIFNFNSSLKEDILLYVFHRYKIPSTVMRWQQPGVCKPRQMFTKLTHYWTESFGSYEPWVRFHHQQNTHTGPSLDFAAFIKMACTFQIKPASLWFLY